MTAVGSTSDVRVGVNVLVGVLVAVFGPGVLVFVGVLALVGVLVALPGVQVGCTSLELASPPVTHGAVVGVLVGLPGVQVGGCFSEAITPLPVFVTHGAVVGVLVGLPGVQVGGCFSDAITPLPVFVTHGAVVGVFAGFVGVLVAFAAGVQVGTGFTSEAATPLDSGHDWVGVGVAHGCTSELHSGCKQVPSFALVD